MIAGQIVDSGFAAVAYDGPFNTVSLLTSAVGGSTVSLSSTPTAGTTQVIANASDVVTVGSNAPAQGGTLSQMGELNLGMIAPSESATFILDDSGDTQTGRQVTFNSDSYAWGVSGLSVGRIYLGSGAHIEVLGGSPAPGQQGSNSYAIQSVPAGISLTLKASSGGDTVNVGSSTNTLDPIQGALSIYGNNPNTLLSVDDQGTVSGEYYSIGSTQVERRPFSPGQPTGSPTQTINYFGLGSLSVHGSSAADSWAVSSTLARTTTALYSNGGASGNGNEFSIGNPLDNIQGPVAVHGAGIYDVALDYDSRNPSGHTYTLSTPNPTTTMLQRDGVAPITHDGIGELILGVPVVGGNHINVQGVAANLFANIQTFNGDQDVVGSLAPTTSGGTMSAIQGNVSFTFEANQVTTLPTLTLDDSGDNSTAPRDDQQLIWQRPDHQLGRQR
jgi:hypothetical protein